MTAFTEATAPLDNIAPRFGLKEKAASMPTDAIMKANDQYKEMLRRIPGLKNAGIGEIRDPETSDDAPHSPWIPTVIKEAMVEHLFETGYQPPTGDPSLAYLIAGRVALGDEMTTRLYGNEIQRHVFAALAAGGTHAKSVAAKFLAAYLPEEERSVFYDSGWPNTGPIYEECGIQTSTYERNASWGWYDHERWLDGLRSAPEGSIADVQLTAYNDDGVGRTKAEWGQGFDLMRRRRMILVIDNPYQGLGEDFEEDRKPIQMAVESGITTIVAGSWSKIGGKYGLRSAGYLAAYNTGENPADMRTLIAPRVRRVISSPPIARDLTAVIADDVKFDRLKGEIKAVQSETVLKPRQDIMVAEFGAAYPWLRLVRGMFVTLPVHFRPEQRTRIIENTGVFIPESGSRGTRFNIGGIPTSMMPNFVHELANNM